MYRLWLDKMQRGGELQALDAEFGYRALTKEDYTVC
jgi:hypothetical protein